MNIHLFLSSDVLFNLSRHRARSDHRSQKIQSLQSSSKKMLTNGDFHFNLSPAIPINFSPHQTRSLVSKDSKPLLPVSYACFPLHNSPQEYLLCWTLRTSATKLRNAVMISFSLHLLAYCPFRCLNSGLPLKKEQLSSQGPPKSINLKSHP